MTVFNFCFRPLVLGVTILLFSPLYLFASKTLISGEFAKGNNQVITISYYHKAFDQCKDTETYVDAIADENGYFTLEFNIENPVSINMLINDNYFFINVFICPGDNVFIDFRRNSVRVTGKGESRLAFGLKFMEYTSKLYRSAPSRYELKPMEYLTSRKKIMDESIQFLKDNLCKDSLAEEFRQAFISDIKYRFAVDYCQYSWINPQESSIFFQLDTMAKHFKGIEINNQQIAESNGYFPFFLRELPYALFSNMTNLARSNEEKNELLMNQYLIRDSIAKVFFTGENYENALFIILKENISDLKYYQGTDNFESKYSEIEDKLESYKKSFLNQKKYVELEGYLSKYKQLRSKVLDFIATDEDGNKVKISDFEGKVIYLDFWATSCAPCVAEIPFANNLQQKLKDEEDFVFIALSFDRNMEYAKKIIKEREFKVVHLFEPKGMNSEIARAYNINGIPRYFIIDKEGNLISEDAKRPSDHPENLLREMLLH